MKTPYSSWGLALGLLLAGLGGEAARAQQPTPLFVGASPLANSVAAPATTPVQARFFGSGTPLDASAPAGLRVFSSQRGGQRAGHSGAATLDLSLEPTLNQSVLQFQPSGYGFRPGETVSLSLTRQVVNTAGAALAQPKVLQFRTATGGSGRGAFRPGSEVPVSPAPDNLLTADLDNDGDLDLVTYTQTTNSLSIYLNTGAGTFGSASTVPTTGFYGTGCVAAGDVDNDGDLDLVASDLAGSGGTVLRTLLNDGTGTFTNGSRGTLYYSPRRLVLGDLDGDGDLDLAATMNQLGIIQLRYNDGTGTFPGNDFPGGPQLPQQNEVRDIALADVDQDYDLDLVAIGNSGGNGLGRLTVLLNGGNASGSNTGVFTTTPSASHSVVLSGSALALALADLDGDHDLDIAAVGLPSGQAQTVEVLLNGSGTGGAATTAPGTFGNSRLLPAAPDTYALALTDVDADGDLDVLTAGANQSTGTPGGLCTAFNDGLAAFGTPAARTVRVGTGAQALALGDVDNDGDVDALTANRLSGTVSVRLNGPGPEINVLAGATAYASGSSYNVGDLVVGGSSGSVAFTIQNLSPTDTLTITSAGLSGNTGLVTGFGISSTPFILPPGATDVLSVTVTAPAVGPLTAQFTIASNDLDEPAYELNLTANGITLPDLVVSGGSLNIPSQASSGPYRNVTVTSTGALYAAQAGLEVHGTLLVQSGGVLQVGFTTNCEEAITGPGDFTLEDGGTLIICPAAGISASGATGAIQVTGTRSYSPGATYTYVGMLPQVTGSGLPAQVRNLTSSTGTQGSLSLSQPVAVKEVLRVQSTPLNTAGHALTLLSDASGTALLVNQNNGRVVGDATVERYNSSPYRGSGYRHYSAPISNATIGSLGTATWTPVVNPAYNTAAQPGLVTPFPTVFGFGQNAVFDNGWASPQALTDAMTVGYGYTVQIPATETVRFTGPLNQEQLSFGMANNTSLDGAYYLLGNPYAAPLDWSTITEGSGPFDNLYNIGTAVYVFEATGPYTGSYRTAVAGIGGSPVIASGQGFFVRTGPIGLGQYTFQLFNRNRVTTFSPANNTFHRNGPDLRPLLTLALHDAAGHADPSSIYFTPAATPGFDLSHDAAKLPNTTGLNLASRLGTADYAINGLPLLGTQPLVLPLSVGVPAAGTYELAVDQLVNFAPGTMLYLHDALLGTLTPLAPGTRYAFTLAGFNAPNRFTVEFRPGGALATAAQLLDAQVQVFPNPAKAASGVTIAAPARARITVLNALGQVVLPAQVVGAPAALHLPTAGLAAGLYVLRIHTEAGEVSRRLVVE